MLVAVEQAEQSYLVGFAASGPVDSEALAPDEPAEALGPDVVAVTDLLVEPRWGRRGHGSRLLAASVDLWREDGFTGAVAWAFEATRQPASSSPHRLGTRRRRPGAGRGRHARPPGTRLHVAVPAEPTDAP